MTLRPLLLLLALAVSAPAYNPPVDTAGPLTIRLQEPAIGAYGAGGLVELSRPGVPLTLPVSLENAGEAPLHGAVRLGLIDRWKADPSGPVSFSLAPRGRVRLEFRLVFGEGTYNAIYPVHAFAEFEHDGKRFVAHPVLLLNVRQPDPPRARLDIPWTPVKAPEHGALGLWRLPVRRESVRIEQPVEPGATGREIYETGPTAQYGVRVSRPDGREAISVALGKRPPAMRERVAAAIVEYPLELPRSQPLKLRFAGAASDVAAGKIMLRVRAVDFDAPSGEPGAVLLEQPAGVRWQEAEADLSRFAGRRIRLQLECSADSLQASGQAHWAEPAVIAGQPPTRPPFPPASDAHSRLLGKIEGFEVRVWPGERGMLDAAVEFRDGARRLAFHGFRARVLGDSLDDWRSASRLVEAREEPAAGRYRVRHRFDTWAGGLDLLGELWIESGALRAHFWLENTPKPRPWLDVHIEEIAAGEWSQRAERVYAGVGNVIRDPQAFRLNFDGHSMATSYAGFDFAGGVSLVLASDVAPDRLEVDPDRRIYTFNTPHPQTLAFLPTKDVWSAVKTWRTANGAHASAGVPRLAGRFVFDLWRGRYGDSAAALQRAFRYGLTDAAVVWHSWQRWGYDYRLPDIYPPNPDFGAAEQFKELVEACWKNGVLFAPHDNYIDYYPDSDGFSYSNIAFEPNGQPRRAWFNYGRGAQSYRARADRVRPFLERNVKLIRDGFSPTAYFIDVWSSLGPYDYWTEDGRFVPKSETRRAWGESFAWIRDFLGDNTPQISEAGHDQLIGWLDGAQANHLRVDATPGRNFVWNIRCADAERIPWIDAAYHDVFALHGAGYPGRYAGGLDEREHGIYSDDYIATEVLTGHPGMVPAPFGRDVVRKYWLLHDFMQGLALRRIDAFRFAGGDLHRQEVRWDNGAEVFVNRGAANWNNDGHTLPQYGFYARVPLKAGAVEAAIEQRDGAVVEWSRSPSIVYVNTRGNKPVSIGPITTDGGFRIERDADGARLIPLPGSRPFAVRLRWKDLRWTARAPRQAEALDENGRVLSRAESRSEGEELILTCEPNVFAYRLR